MRDWGAEGAAERSQSYGRILTELKKRLLPADAKLPLASPPKVLVPGAGLGRLCVDIAALGLEAQASAPPPPAPPPTNTHTDTHTRTHACTMRTQVGLQIKPMPISCIASAASCTADCKFSLLHNFRHQRNAQSHHHSSAPPTSPMSWTVYMSNGGTIGGACIDQGI